MNAFRDAGHLFRVAVVFVGIGFAVFGVNARLLPEKFWQYGNYGVNAMSEMAARPVNFAGHQACEDCHADVLGKKESGKHVHVNCEACHGPLATHVDDPGSVTPAKLDTADRKS